MWGGNDGHSVHHNERNTMKFIYAVHNISMRYFTSANKALVYAWASHRPTKFKYDENATDEQFDARSKACNRARDQYLFEAGIELRKHGFYYPLWSNESVPQVKITKEELQ